MHAHEKDCYSEAYSQLCQTPEMELLAKILNRRKPLTIFAKSAIFTGSEYAPNTVHTFLNTCCAHNFLCKLHLKIFWVGSNLMKLILNTMVLFVLKNKSNRSLLQNLAEEIFLGCPFPASKWVSSQVTDRC